MGGGSLRPQPNTGTKPPSIKLQLVRKRARSKEVGNPLIFFISLQDIRSGILRVTGTVPGPAGAGVQERPLRPRGRVVSAWAACCCAAAEEGGGDFFLLLLQWGFGFAASRTGISRA
jgi:hypothetical protein